MFIETAIAVFALGTVIGYAANEILRAGPRDTENESLRLRLAERAWMDEQEAHNLERFRKHLGTPYRAETRLAALPPELADAIETVVDDHNGSRRALEAVK